MQSKVRYDASLRKEPTRFAGVHGNCSRRMAMALFAMAIPIPPGKTDQWRQFMEQLRGPRNADYKASRDRLGVRERAFLQRTPHGDLVIVTLEGDNPTQAFMKFAEGTDPFT